MYLKFITFDVKNKTIEATFFEDIVDAGGVVVEQKPVKCRNYSEDQLQEFLTDVPVGTGYAHAAGWVV